MANFPRPGIIQLDHPNIYNAAKQAQDENWLRQGLGVAGDMLANRNQRVRYDQAAGVSNEPTNWEAVKLGVGKVADILQAPFSTTPKIEQSPEPAVRAPDYGKMASIDPERAKFDWMRQESELDRTAKREIEDQKIAAKNMSAGSLDELQQLWKDNSRGLVEAKKIQDSTAAAMYQANIDRLIPLLKQKAPDVWGAPEETAVEAPEGGDDFKQRKEAAKSDAFAAIKTFAVDKNDDGVIDAPEDWVQAIASIRDKYGVSDADMADVNRAWESAVKKIADVKSAKVSKEETQYARSRQQKQDELSLADKKAAVGALVLAYDNLQKNPNDKTYKSSALTSVLRKESGAAIGASEFMGRMKEWLPPDKYQKLQDEMSGLGMLVAGRLSGNAAEIWQDKIADKYMGYVDTGKLLKFMDAMTPEYAKKKTKEPSAQSQVQSTRKPGESLSAYRKRIGK